MVISAAMGAFALVLPVAFHAAGLGSKFLPMLLPLLLNGFLVRWRWALATALVVPWISAFATGMPPVYPPVAVIVSAEGAVMAVTASLLYRRGRSRVWAALIPAVLAGRMACFVTAWLLARVFALPPGLAALAATLEGLPGVALQLAVVPLVLRLLGRRKGPLFGAGAADTGAG